MREDVVGAEAVLQHGGLRAGEPELLPRPALAEAPAIAVVLVVQRRSSLLALPTATTTRRNNLCCSLLPARFRRPLLIPAIAAAAAMILRRDQLAEQPHRHLRRRPAGLSDLEGQARVELLLLHAAAGGGEARHGKLCLVVLIAKPR